MNDHDRQKIQREREKLDRLIDKALQDRTPISETHEIIKQSKKLQELMLDSDSENEGNKKA